jgi:transposase
LALFPAPRQAHDLVVDLGKVLRRVPTPQRLIANRAYNARKLHDWLLEWGCEVGVRGGHPFKPDRKNRYPWDKAAHRTRSVIERMFCRLKDFRRVATRYDTRPDTYFSTVLIAATVAWWIN